MQKYLKKQLKRWKLKISTIYYKLHVFLRNLNCNSIFRRSVWYKLRFKQQRNRILKLKLRLCIKQWQLHISNSFNQRRTTNLYRNAMAMRRIRSKVADYKQKPDIWEYWQCLPNMKHSKSYKFNQFFHLSIVSSSKRL